MVQTSKGWFPRLNIHPGEAHADRDSAKKAAIAQPLKEAASRLVELRDLKKSLLEDEGSNGKPKKAKPAKAPAEEPKAEEPKAVAKEKKAKAPVKEKKAKAGKKGDKKAAPEVEEVETLDEVIDEEVVEGSEDEEFKDDDFSEFDNDLDT